MSRQAVRALIATVGLEAEEAAERLETTAEMLLSALCSKSLPKALAKHRTAHEAVCLQLACERLGVKFNQQGAIMRSAVTEKVYYECLAEARMVLGQPAKVDFHTLSVTFGCTHAEDMAEEALKSYLGCVDPGFPVSYPTLYAALFILVCKELKVPRIKREEVQRHASVTDSALKAMVKHLEHHYYTIISQICGGQVLPTSRKRTRTTGPAADEVDAQGSSSVRGRKASGAAAVSPRDAARRRSKRLSAVVVLSASRHGADTPAVAKGRRRPLAVSPMSPKQPSSKLPIGRQPPDEISSFEIPDLSERQREKEDTAESQRRVVPRLESRQTQCGAAPATGGGRMTPMISSTVYQDTRKYQEYLQWRATVLARLGTVVEKQ